MAERKVRRIYHPPAVPAADLFGSSKRRRAAAYARVSTASDEQLNSVEAQKDYFEKLIQRRPDWLFVGVYADEGITGTSINRREAFNQMVADALAGNIDLIVTKSISRFARNIVDTLYTELSQRYESTKAGYEALLEQRKQMEARAIVFSGIIFCLGELSRIPMEFNETLWHTLVDHVTIHNDERIVFTFTDGTEIVTML